MSNLTKADMSERRIRQPLSTGLPCIVDHLAIHALSRAEMFAHLEGAGKRGVRMHSVYKCLHLVYPLVYLR